MFSVSLDEDWRPYWGTTPLPNDVVPIGVVTRSESKTDKVGALLQAPSGMYIQGNNGSAKGINNQAIRKIMNQLTTNRT